MINEARILLEAAAAALELPNPDIAVIRALIKDADDLLAKASNEQAGA
jgi:hypothetical protein